MSGYKKYPHVPSDSVVLKLDDLSMCLEDYLRMVSLRPGGEEMTRVAREALAGVREVVSRRGKTLSVQRRRGGRPGTYMTVR